MVALVKQLPVSALAYRRFPVRMVGIENAFLQNVKSRRADLLNTLERVAVLVEVGRHVQTWAEVGRSVPLRLSAGSWGLSLDLGRQGLQKLKADRLRGCRKAQDRGPPVRTVCCVVALTGHGSPEFDQPGRIKNALVNFYGVGVEPGRQGLENPLKQGHTVGRVGQVDFKDKVEAVSRIGNQRIGPAQGEQVVAYSFGACLGSGLLGVG